MKKIISTVPSSVFSFPIRGPLEKILFFDIETTGLSPRASSIYLIGAMHYAGSENSSPQQPWEIIQWFADDYRSEEKLLRSFLDYLEDYDALWHFNGSTFDIPYVLARCEKHKITPSSHCLSLFQDNSTDLLRRIRPMKKTLRMEKANQTALERWLGITRQDTFNGGQLISVYSEYMQNKFLHPEKASSQEDTLLLHNHDDIACMLDISSILSYEEALCPCSAPAVISCDVSQERLTITFSLPYAVPRPMDLSHPLDGLFAGMAADMHLEEKAAALTLPLFRGTLKLFFEPVRDYFYLPAEDTAIHKSVAAFVEPEFREKAKASNCYTKKEGAYFPSLASKKPAGAPPVFYTAYREKPACYLLEENAPDKQKEELAQYLLRELPFF